MRPRCPPDELLSQFLADRLSPAGEDDLEQHLRTCDGCRERLDRMSAQSTTTPHLRVCENPPLSPEFAQRLEDSLQDSLGDVDSDEFHAVPEIPGYEVLETVGRGGSSVVYRAIDQKRQRAVAIKVLRARASQVDRERFNREVQALTALRHPNITRSRGAGEIGDHPYLVLEYVAGGSLGRFIAGKPQDPKASARFVHQVADAIQAAHAVEFVHRDLKPSNILLEPQFGPPEAKGLDLFAPKVTDFGIVKDLTRDDGFTKTRDCVGTPSYMAPEQVQGSTQPVDSRTDVYAMGAVLYELLTGRPPFRAGSPLDTMLLVKHEEPVTPSRFQPRIPGDLETICLKCLEKEPRQRYQSAQLLANDLDRFLNGQPITARRSGWPTRLWRWTRRNPGWAAATALALLTLLAFAIGGPLVAKRERDLREQASQNEQQAIRERARARDQFEAASSILDDTLSQVLRSARLQDSALDDVRARLTRGAVPYYEQVLQADSSDRSVRLKQARAHLQLATVHAKDNDSEKARESFERSLDILESLSRESVPLDRTTRSSLGSAHVEYGRFLHLQGKDLDDAERHYRVALTHRTALLEESPQDASSRDSAAIVMSLLGALIQETPARRDEAEALQVRVTQLRDQLVAELPDRMDLRHYAALAHMNLGIHYRVQNKHDDEIRQMQRAWELERDIVESADASGDTPYYLSLFEGELAIAFGRAGRPEDAIRHVKSALRSAEAMEMLYPKIKKYSDLTSNHREVLAVAEKQRADSR